MFMVDDNVQRLDITMHDSVAVGKLECFEDFVRVEPDVHVVEGRRDNFGLDVWNVLEHQAWRFGDGVSQDIVKFDDIWAAVKGLQDFGFPVDFLLADWFEDFDDTWLVVLRVTALIHF